MVNFTTCAATYINNTALISKWGYTGPVIGIPKNNNSQITYEGCKAVCGAGNAWYPWTQSSSTITTWVLPIMGVLLQAPFESNAFWRTVWAIARWCGSPMASLSYILWNIAVSGKCALMVDMAVPYNDRSHVRNTDFGSIRDSFYILMNMNQFSMKPVKSLKVEAEGLLRIALFSKDLRLHGDGQASLRELRQELAQSLRERRRRGVVPVYISILWYLFSFAISIQAAFGQLGENATAHDLALGSLLGWLPILVMCSIVDRNPVGSDDIRKRLNELVDIVARSLRNRAIMNEFVQTFAQSPKGAEMRARVEKISEQAEYFMGEFFTGFAGQGRVRWHYGAAQPILSDIENCYVAEHGRDWMHNEQEARTELVLGSSERGLFWFDFRQLWQITASFIIVGGCVFGAIILSYFTPTVGLGCRSLGYLIFFIFALVLLALEFLVWWLSSDEREEARLRRPLVTRRPTFQLMEEMSETFFQRAASWNRRRTDELIDLIVEYVPKILSLAYAKERRPDEERKLRGRLEATLGKWRDYTLREWSDRLFFRPLELVNTGWLVYISMAQTFGSYNNCKCQCSIYGGRGGYMDLSVFSQAPLDWVRWYWTTGTVLSSIIIGSGMTYVVLEWCLQSHLSTEGDSSARQGLRRTRLFRHTIFFLRYPTNVLIHSFNRAFDFATRWLRRDGYHRQKSLYWTKNITHSGPRRPSRSRGLPEYSPYARQARTFGSYAAVTTTADVDRSYGDPDGGSPMTPLVRHPSTAYDAYGGQSPFSSVSGPSGAAAGAARRRPSDAAVSLSSPSVAGSPRPSTERPTTPYAGPLHDSYFTHATAFGIYSAAPDVPGASPPAVPVSGPPAAPVPAERLDVRPRMGYPRRSSNGPPQLPRSRSPSAP